jgi:hypothetical protein
LHSFNKYFCIPPMLILLYQEVCKKKGKCQICCLQSCILNLYFTDAKMSFQFVLCWIEVSQWVIVLPTLCKIIFYTEKLDFSHFPYSWWRILLFASLHFLKFYYIFLSMHLYEPCTDLIDLLFLDPFLKPSIFF